MTNLLDDFREKLGCANVIEGQGLERYRCDWSGIDPCSPIAVVRPKATAEVAYVMRKCNEAGQRVVVQGGLTGLCSGATPQTGELALSLERLVEIEGIDSDSMTMTVLAGTPLQTIQERALADGFQFPLDLGARGSCTIGGNIATNAGGTEVIRFGMARALVLGLEAVLSDGTIVSSMNKMLKNNAGFDLKHLFIGTEGTLGIITRAVLRLYPAPGATFTALCAVDGLDDCIHLLQQLRKKLDSSLSSFEVMWPDYLQYISDNVGDIRFPISFDGRYFILVECVDVRTDANPDNLEFALQNAMEDGVVKEAIIAKSQRESTDIWRLREAIAELFQQMRNGISFDISAPVGMIGAMLDGISKDLARECKAYTYKKITYGHLGDSNVHLTISTEKEGHIGAISDIVYRNVGDKEGSISGEHGIGMTKRKYLPLSRSAKEIELMRGLKNLLDPNSILNVDRVLP